MQRWEHLCSDNAQKVMKGAGGTDTVEHDDHDDQLLNFVKQHLQKKSSTAMILVAFRPALLQEQQPVLQQEQHQQQQQWRELTTSTALARMVNPTACVMVRSPSSSSSISLSRVSIVW